ncbi:MAG: metallophosphoesterase [Chloroflexota bacterium]
MSDNGRMPLRVLHTADLHLEIFGDSACRGLEAVVNVAITAKVDLVIIAGDLFDHNRVRDNVVSFAIEQLQRLSVDVVILPGNHDCLAADSVFGRMGLWQTCTNVRFLRSPEGETLDLPDLGVSLWGKPIDTYDGDIHPLDGIPRPVPNGHWHVAIAHGYYVTEPPVFPSFHITEEEIATSGWDYIALGHYPGFRCVCNEPVKAYYCDSPVSGTVNIIDFSEEAGVQVTRYAFPK